MKKILLLAALLILPLTAHEKPWKVTGSFMYSEGRALECQLFTSLALIQETFDIETLRDDFYSDDMEENIKRWILNVRSQFIELRHKNIPHKAFIKSITIVPDEDSEANLPPGKFALKDVDVSISFLFSIDETPDELSIKWLFTPEPFLDLLRLDGKRVRPEDAEITVTFAGNDIKNYTLSAEKPVFRWKNSEKKAENIIPQKETVLRQVPKQAAADKLLICAVFFLIITCWAFIGNLKIRNAAELVVLIIGCGVIFLVDLNPKEHQTAWTLPEQTELETMMTRRLTDIYRGTSASGPEMLFNRLQKAASGDFLNSTFVKLFKSKVEHFETVQMIEKVTLDECKVTSEKEIECSWTVKAFILHLGHVHEKDLHFKALFKMNPESGKWLIENGEVLAVFKDEEKT